MSELQLSRQQVREVDQIAIERFGMPGVVLMENAGRGCVEILIRNGVPQRVLIACGKGNNAGDGYVMARHLQLAGSEVFVISSSPETLTGDAGVNQHIWLSSGGAIHVWDDRAINDWTREAVACDWVVDALLGTGARGPLRPPIRDIVAWLNQLPGRKLAVDIPTGLDCDTGDAQVPTFAADITCTFVAKKLGFPNAPCQTLGEVEVIGIGVPACVLDKFRP